MLRYYSINFYWIGNLLVIDYESNKLKFLDYDMNTWILCSDIKVSQVRVDSVNGL